MEYLEVKKRDAVFNISPALPPLLQEWFLTDFKEWEEETFDVLDEYLSNDGVFLDIGAWVGPMTMYAARKCKKCYSIEPSPAAFSMLSKNIALNPDIECALTLINCAVGMSDSSGILHAKSLINSAATLLSGSEVSDDDAVRVPIKSMESLIREYGLGDVSFVKVDVEGYEGQVVPGLLPLLKANGASLLLSLHPWLLPPEEIDSLLELCLSTFNRVLSDDMKKLFDKNNPRFDEHGGITILCD